MPPRTTNSPATIEALLTTPGTWAVVGLSNNPDRDALGVSGLVRRLGHRVVPVHPRAEPVFGETAYRSLSEIPDEVSVDVVDCFVNSARVGEVVDEAIAQRDRLGIHAVWLQLGVVDDDAAQRALAAGLDVVMNRCPAIEARRLAIAPRG